MILSDNAQALGNTAAPVASFRTGTIAPPPCSYSVSPSSLSFTATGGSAQVAVTAGSGCGWTVDRLTWVAVGPGGSGVGHVTVDVAANTGRRTDRAA